jgi:diaminobutyrate acetyltransferase
MKTSAPNLRVRAPTALDGAAVWGLVQAAGGLDLNSSYAYLLLCDRFSATCQLADSDHGLAGAALAFRPPDRPDAIFVWQIAVAPAHRGAGVGRLLLERLVQSGGCRGARVLEAHVSEGNHASEALFRSFARRVGAEVRVADGYAPRDFPDAHQRERLFEIGPLPAFDNHGRNAVHV